ncbi:MAG: hypothetical protein ACXAAO_04430 [Candidatus Thorarchaeota archaeon]|jgi:hypothetical protein
MTEDATTGHSELVSEVEDMESEEFELTEVSEESKRVKQAAFAAIMAALSLASSPIVSVIPRIPGWDIALFDPVSFFWIIAFLVGGYFVGSVTAIAGTIGLFFFDPSGFGPLFKLLATAPMIIIPWLAVRFSAPEEGGSKLASLQYFVMVMLAATALRLLIMVPTNLVMVPLLYGPFLTADFIISYTIILNLSQSLWDALIPYLLVHKSQIFEKFGMW